ncbi:MAG: hypothetical protein RLZZ488_559 [Pseudomonadota bacterium]|jgi:hypothetical protein
MSLVGAAFAFSLHATPFFVFPVFPSGPFGGFGLSVLFEETATSNTKWRFGLGAGDALNDALNFAAEGHTSLTPGISFSGGISAHVVKDYQNYFKQKLFSTDGLLSNPTTASWATGYNAHLGVRWESNPNRSELIGSTSAGFFVDLGVEREFFVWKLNERSINDKSGDFWVDKENRLPSGIKTKIYCTAGVLLFR